jgi:hypothetical protein
MSFIAMHETFQHDLFRLRLNTARACVSALQSCSNPFSTNTQEPLKMSAQVFIIPSVQILYVINKTFIWYKPYRTNYGMCIEVCVFGIAQLV